MNFGYHPEAEAEYSAAALFYEKRRPGLGADFIDEVERAMERIHDGPEHWPEIESEIRRCQLHRFPYGILYIKENDEIEIIAVAHFRAF